MRKYGDYQIRSHRVVVNDPYAEDDEQEGNAVAAPSDLVFPARNLADRLHAYALRNIRPGGNDPRGYPLYAATQALESVERTLRTLYTPNHEGL